MINDILKNDIKRPVDYIALLFAVVSGLSMRFICWCIYPFYKFIKVVKIWKLNCQ